MNGNGCIDAGREGCPCALATWGKCLICGRLSGGTCQDCNWQGTCIYSLYEQNRRNLVKAREERLLHLVNTTTYSSDFKVITLEADRGFCQRAQTAGAYVFARAAKTDQWNDTPISILKAEPEKRVIHLAVCGCGPKSQGLLTADQNLLVRGVYYNGLSGIGSLHDAPVGTVVYAKGVAIAPLYNFLDGGARYGKWMKNLHIFIDADRIGFDFLKDYFGDLPAESIKILDFANAELPDIHREDGMNVMALTSPYFVKRIEEAWGQTVVKPTAGNMCCGEGVCGACTFDDHQGKTIHRCKVRT